jgi:hypothetical protein
MTLPYIAAAEPLPVISMPGERMSAKPTCSRNSSSRQVYETRRSIIEKPPASSRAQATPNKTPMAPRKDCDRQV